MIPLFTVSALYTPRKTVWDGGFQWIFSSRKHAVITLRLFLHRCRKDWGRVSSHGATKLPEAQYQQANEPVVDYNASNIDAAAKTLQLLKCGCWQTSPAQQHRQCVYGYISTVSSWAPKIKVTNSIPAKKWNMVGLSPSVPELISWIMARLQSIMKSQWNWPWIFGNKMSSYCNYLLSDICWNCGPT